MSLLALALAAFGGAGAVAEAEEPMAKPPMFTGFMAFPMIESSDGPEQFLWEVRLQGDQTLVQVDERHAEVLYEGGPHTAFRVTAEQAHDANGVEVPTSFEVIAPNLVSLTVHHRAGNPAAGGSSFRYPVMAGQPYEVGYSTVTVSIPEAGEPPVPTCIVPRLSGRSLTVSRTKLAAANCKLGAVRGKRGKGTKVVKQFRAPGAVLGAGARVAVKLG